MFVRFPVVLLQHSVRARIPADRLKHAADLAHDPALAYSGIHYRYRSGLFLRGQIRAVAGVGEPERIGDLAPDRPGIGGHALVGLSAVAGNFSRRISGELHHARKSSD